MKKNIFWIRALTAFFSLLSYVIMSTVPYIAFSTLTPSEIFEVSTNVFDGLRNFAFSVTYRAYAARMYVCWNDCIRTF